MDNHVLASCCLSFVYILLILGQVRGLEIGGELINRPLNDTRDNSTTIINPDQTIGIAGLLVGFKAFMLNSKDCIWLHVWRKATGGSLMPPTRGPYYTTPGPWWRPSYFRTVAGLPIYPAVGYPYWMMIGKTKNCIRTQEEGKVFSYNIPSDQYIRVEKDDVIGFSAQSSNPIPYSMDNVSCLVNNMSLEPTGSMHPRFLRQDRIYGFGELHECRTYSLRAIINQKECKHIIATHISQNLTITTTGGTAVNICWILQAEAIVNGSKAQTEMKLTLRAFTRSCSQLRYANLQIREGNSSTSPKMMSVCQKPSRFSNSRIIRPITTGSAYVKFTRKAGAIGSLVNVVLEYLSITIAPCIKVRVGENPSLIESPGYPYHDYPSNTKICWTLFIPNNSTERIRVVLDVSNADIQPPNKACRPWDNSCSACNDFIEVRDGNDSNAPMLTKWCNESGRNLIETSSNQILTVIFVSDGFAQKSGFQMKAFTVSPETVTCFHYIGLSTAALIESPHYPNSYPGRRNDCWSVRAVSKKQRLLLTIKDSYLDAPPNKVCAANVIEIRDGVGSTAQLLRRWCRKTVPEPILSSGPYLFIHFVKDRYHTARFALSYQQLESDACTTFYAYPHISYLKQEVNQSASLGVHCWVLRSEEGPLRIRWDSIDQRETQTSGICNQNYIQVHDGDSEASSLIGRFCGDNPIPASGIESNASALYIEWVVTTFPAKLQIGYTALSILNCVVVPMTRAEMYMTHKGPEYLNPRGDFNGGSTGSTGSHPQPIAPCSNCKYKANSQNCWTVTSTNPNDHLLVKVIFLELQDKNNQSRCVDFLELHDGESGSDPQLAMLCGTVNQMNFTTTGRAVRIMFQTDDQVERRGFRLEISRVHAGGCTSLEAKNYNLTFGGSRFPGGPGISVNSGQGDKCWTIHSPSPALPIIVTARYIRLGMDQALLFYDGPSNEAPLIRKLDFRSDGGAQVVSSGGNMTVVLDTGSLARVYRLAMSYAWLFAGQCQYISLSSKAAYLTTTGFGLHNYSKDDYKCWVLTSLDPTHIIELKARSFVLENATSCSSDYLDIYEGPKRSDDKLLHRWCGNQNDKVLARSSGRSLYVFFSSNEQKQYPGFSIKATAIRPPTSDLQGACVYLPISDSDYIATKNYGIESYPNNDYECWSLTAVEPDHTLEIRADIFVTEYHDLCSADYLEIYDGPAKYHTNLLHHWCGIHSGQVLAKSSGRSLFLVFKSDDSTQYAGFKLQVTAVDSSIPEEKVIQTISQGGGERTSMTTIILLVMVGCVIIAVIVIIACWVFRKKKNQTRPTPEVVYTTNSNNPMSLGNFSAGERGLADGTQISAPQNSVKEAPQVTKDTAKLVVE